MQMNVNLCDFVLMRARIFLLAAGRLVGGLGCARAQRRQLTPAPFEQRAVVELYGERRNQINKTKQTKWKQLHKYLQTS